MPHKLNWFSIGKIISVNDKMQKNYTYVLTAKRGSDFEYGFDPQLTPKQMLAFGVFEGKYLNDCMNEFPIEWYSKGKFADSADESINLFKIKSRLSLHEWQNRGWIPIKSGDNDVRGWFQWYCRYWLGRRDTNVDAKQIARWRAFVRHRGQIIADIKRKKLTLNTVVSILNHRPRQRQALLQWAYDPMIIE